MTVETADQGVLKNAHFWDDRGWGGWMASPTQRTWVWVDSGSWWWTGRPGVLQFMGSQRARRDWATELNWQRMFETILKWYVMKWVQYTWESLSPTHWITYILKLPRLSPVFFPWVCFGKKGYRRKVNSEGSLNKRKVFTHKRCRRNYKSNTKEPVAWKKFSDLNLLASL